MSKYGIGQPVLRFEDPRLLRGQGRFINDVNLHGQTYAVFVRSPHAHAAMARRAALLALATAAAAASSAGATITNAYGVLVYDDTLATPVADQGVCYNYLGGANSVTNGVFTVVWHANGIFRITLA